MTKTNINIYRNWSLVILRSFLIIFLLFTYIYFRSAKKSPKLLFIFFLVLVLFHLLRGLEERTQTF